jgi:DNA repair ATPase RecN
MSIKSALKAAVDAASTMLESPELPTGHDVLEQREAEISVLLERLKVAERINREYFEVIEAIERERDEWKAMLFEQSSEHQNAQSLLQKGISDSVHHLRAAIKQLDWFRKAADLEPIETPAMLGTLPMGVPEAFGEKIKALVAAALPQTNGRERRAEIAKKLVENVRPK